MLLCRKLGSRLDLTESAAHTRGPAVSLTPVGPNSHTILCLHVPPICLYRLGTDGNCRLLALSYWLGEPSALYELTIFAKWSKSFVEFGLVS